MFVQSSICEHLVLSVRGYNEAKSALYPWFLEFRMRHSDPDLIRHKREKRKYISC